MRGYLLIITFFTKTKNILLNFPAIAAFFFTHTSTVPNIFLLSFDNAVSPTSSVLIGV